MSIVCTQKSLDTINGGNDNAKESSRTSFRWTEKVLLFVSLALASLIYALSPFHSLSTGDELVPVLVSTQSMSVFYWGADRFGMLLPLLARFIRDPLWNLVAQNFLCAFMAFFSFFAACRFFFGPGRWLLAGSMMTLISLVWPPVEPMGSYMSIGQSFAPSAAALFAGLLVLDGGGDESPCSALGPGRLLAVLVLLCVSFWVNIGMFLTALPLALGSCFVTPRSRSVGRRQIHRSLVVVGSAVLALALNLALKSYYAEQYSAHDYSLLPFSFWPDALARLAANFIAVFYSHSERNILFACVAVTSCVSFFVLWRDTKGEDSLLSTLWQVSFLICLAIIANFIFYGTNAWVRINHFEGRYLVMVYFLLTCLLCGVAAEALQKIIGRGKRIIGWALIVLIPLVSLKSYGSPAVGMLEMGLEERFGLFADEVLRCGCTHVAGTYWKVWPVVFYSNVKLYRIDGSMVWGVSYRSDNTAGLWSDQVKGPWRVCALRGDSQADAYIARFGLVRAERIEIDAPLFEH